MERVMSEATTTAVEPVKITALEVEGFKRVNAVQIVLEPKGLIILGGSNMEGKTSVLDAIASSLGGEKFGPTDPIHHGAKRAKTTVTLSNGLKVERVFTPRGTRLEVMGSTGDATGQTLLNRFITAFALDLSGFLSASEKARTKLLLQTIGVDLTPFEVRHADLYAKRTQVGREEDRAKGHYESLPYHDGAGEVEQSGTALLSEIREVEAHNRRIADAAEAVQAAQEARRTAEAALRAKVSGTFDDESVRSVAGTLDLRTQRAKDIQSNIDQLKAQLDRELLELAKVENDIRATEDRLKAEQITALDRARVAVASAVGAEESALEELNSAGEVGDVEPLNAKLAEIEDINRKIRQNIDRKAAANKHAALREEYLALTKDIEDNQAEMRALLDGAKMPIRGLSVDIEGRLIFRGQAWDCCSGTEQLMVATAICHAIKPEMGFVLIDGVEQMDLNTLSLFGQWLERENIQAITTRVSSGPECTLIIEDGMVKADAPVTQNP